MFIITRTRGRPGLRQQVRNRKGASSWKRWLKLSGPRKEELRQDLKSLFQGAIRVTLEMVLEEELRAMVGARRFERVGSREGGSPADVMGRYRRRSEEVDERAKPVGLHPRPIGKPCGYLLIARAA